MKYLLDTNVLSEFQKPKPEQKVLEIVSKLPKESTFISCVSIGEIRRGIALCQSTKKVKDLTQWFEFDLLPKLKDKIINLDFEIMYEWGKLAPELKNIPLMDGLIAATCITHNFHLVTRNVKDFERIKELKIINPWH